MRIIVQVFDENGAQETAIDRIAPYPALTQHKVLIDENYWLNFRSESTLSLPSIPDDQ